MRVIFLCIAFAICATSCSQAAEEVARNDVSERAQLITTTTPAPSAVKGVDAQLRIIASLPNTADVIVVGDSLTARWPQDLLKSTFPGRTTLNYGVSFDQTQNVLWRLQFRELLRLRPTLVVLGIGTNNLRAGLSVPSIIAGIHADVEKLRLVWPSASLAISLIPPMGDGGEIRDADRTHINDAIRSSSTAWGARVLETAPGLACKLGTQCETYIDDRIHFSRQGYELISRYYKSIFGG